MATVIARPLSALMDEAVQIIIRGLRPLQEVTLVARLRENKMAFASHAHYTSDKDGVVDVPTMSATGGTYQGAEPMGFIWSMRPEPGQMSGIRLMKRNVETPLVARLFVYSGHIDGSHPDAITAPVLSETSVERWYHSPHVDRIDVREGRLVATMFMPKGPGPFPGVIDLFGTIGGLVEYRAALLASRGFATMAIAYFWPEKDEIVSDLSYYEEAVEYLFRQPKVMKTGIGAIGVSKGAELACLISVICHKVRAVVSINGPPVTLLLEQTYKDEVFPVSDMTGGLNKTDEGLTFQFDAINMQAPYIIPVERSRAKYLLIHGDDDGACPTSTPEVYQERLRTRGRTDDCDYVIYHNAGHLIEPPHSPHFRTAYHRLYNGIFVWGGRPTEHTRAQEDAWQRTQNFLRQTLTNLPIDNSSKL